ncbi:MAG TPA: 3-isopropylmalate dehydratase [Ignavibacteriales bacterium]|nr:3-isopropylmalate dehydratase [Ignavibacteriales bacterium]HPD68465.1 3-isopropylmalate dehydratase [Ignavibacteriales bacterium]HPP34231.1 3-isopropylmalate dehydratase [Ignavibacteriales bacterium]HRR19591.1 3-isopropylmalate dehydratase [Ignavibacteriales bacterium]HRT99859.1 3-isopropylmalate dehydratase [Ignavibacteriales bacterium]
MEKIIKSKAFVLTDNIDTDQIIPAEHLVYSLTDENEAKMYGKFALSGVPAHQSGLPNGNIKFVDDDKYESNYQILVAGKNFGCGSSREHAPFALQKAGVKAVIAESYARIFYRNAVDGGFLIPLECVNKINDKIETGDELEINLENYELKNLTKNTIFKLKKLGDILPIIEAGDLFEYARKNQLT